MPSPFQQLLGSARAVERAMRLNGQYRLFVHDIHRACGTWAYAQQGFRAEAYQHCYYRVYISTVSSNTGRPAFRHFLVDAAGQLADQADRLRDYSDEATLQDWLDEVYDECIQAMIAADTAQQPFWDIAV